MTIKSSALGSTTSTTPPLAVGVRVSPSDATYMPQIRSAGGSALKTAPGAGYYILVGIEFEPTDAVNADGVDRIDILVALGNNDPVDHPGNPGQNSPEQEPHDLIIDRCYIHGLAGQPLKRGIGLNSKETTIRESYISDFKLDGQDSQAIAGTNGDGPFHILNNYIEGAGENLMFGGGPAPMSQLIPSDIEVRNNKLYKPDSWRSSNWTMKDLFELKSARRVTVDGNIMENGWDSMQQYWAITMTVSPSDSGSWATVQNVTFSNNIVRHAGRGINLLGVDDNNGPSVQGHDILFYNNLFDDINSRWYSSGGGTWAQIRQMNNVTFDHNTVNQNGDILFANKPQNLAAGASGTTMTGFVMTNNIVNHTGSGLNGQDTGIGNNTMETYFPSVTINGVVFPKGILSGNVMIGGSALAYEYSHYPNNYFPDLEDVGFRDYDHGNYRLLETSQFSAHTNAGAALSDDFNDNSRDSTKWNLGVLNVDSNAYNAGVTVNEQNQRLEITPLANTSAQSHNGYVSAASYNFTGGRATVQVPQITTGADAPNGAFSYTIFTVGIDSANWYRIITKDGQIYFQDTVSGVKNTTNITYDATQHRYWRIRHDSASDMVNFETSPDGTNWTVQRSIQRALSLTAMRFELDAGTAGAVSAPGTAIFDDFRFDYASLSADIGANIGLIEWATGYTDTSASTPPAAPTILRITSNDCLTNRIYWIDNSNNETGFKIQHRASGSSTWTTVATINSPNVYKYSVTESGTSLYFYRVIATNSSGDSSASNEAWSGCWHIIDEANTSNAGTLFGDNFDDNAMDTTKWYKGVLNVDSSAYNTGVTVNEQNQRLEITPIANTSDQSHNGYVSASTYDFTGGRASVQVPQIPTGGTALAIFTVGSDSNNWYRIATKAGQIYFQDMVDGVKTSTNITYDSTQHRYWRIQHNAATDKIDFLTSSDGKTWTTQRSGVTRQISITALRIELDAGTYESVSAPGTAIFDDFRFDYNSLSDDFNDNAQDTLKWYKGVLNVDSSAYNTGVTALEQNQRFEIAPIANTSTQSHNGYVTAQTYNFTGGRASVQVPQIPTGGTALAIFTVGIDSNNWYRIATKAGRIYFQDTVGGVKTSTDIAYDSIQHQYWQIRHDSVNDQIIFETSDDGLSWIVRRTIARNLAVTAMQMELDAGTYEAVSGPGTAVFDNFSFKHP